MSWPWPLVLRRASTEIDGDLDGAMDLGLWEDADELRLTAEYFASGVPDGGNLCVSVQIEAGNQCVFQLENPACQFRKRIIVLEDSVEVRSDAFVLPPQWRGRGLGARMFRNSLFAYDALNVRFLTAHANYGNGGYTWARFGARARDCENERAALIAKIPRVVSSGKITRLQGRLLERMIAEHPEQRLMYDLARTANRRDEPLGKWLLIDHSWEAFWDLHDSEHRKLIAEAMTPKTGWI